MRAATASCQAPLLARLAASRYVPALPTQASQVRSRPNLPGCSIVATANTGPAVGSSVQWPTLIRDLVLIFCLGWLAAHVATARGADELPSDELLEAQGARIGSITIRVLPIFDPEESNALYRLADRLHIDTRDSTVNAQLLFGPGDPYLRRILAETERNLRDLRFIREPHIRPVAYHDGVIDVEVVTRDVWTTNPGLSFGRAGGKNKTGVSVEELNLFGRGKQLVFDYSDTVDRSSYTLRWRDPNLFGGRWRSDFSVTDSDDGSGYGIAVERPFYSLDTRHALGVSASRSRGIDSVYALGQQVGEYGRDAQDIDLHFGWSPGVTGGWSVRWTGGARRQAATFSPVTDQVPTVTTPADQELIYPYVRYEAIEDDFETTRNLDLIARTEDLEFGTRYLLELGLADPTFGADRTAVILRAEASRGFRLSPQQSLFVAGSLANRFEGSDIRDGLLAGSLRYYWHTSPQTKFVAILTGELGHNLDDDHEVALGGDSGLRGYPLRFQNGSSRVLLTLEERIYTKYNLFRLADVGAAVFFDVGRTWGNPGIAPLAQSGLLKDIGVGLRLGSTRSALGNVLHLDIAMPLDGDPSISSLQFLVHTERSF